MITNGSPAYALVSRYDIALQPIDSNLAKLCRV